MGIRDTKGMNPSLSLMLFQVLEEAGLGVNQTFSSSPVSLLQTPGFSGFSRLLNSERSRLLNALAVVTAP